MLHPLHSLAFEWHDLSIGRVSIIDKGVVIDVLPFNDEADRYDYATLSLLEAEAVAFDFQGELSLEDLDTLEVAHLEIAESAPGRVTGTLRILPGKGGYWAIRVTNALWRVVGNGSAAAQFPSYA
jgi:hypothetical protein